jgi:peptidyl-prolyl cis-trans isomerase SurA
MNIGLKISAPMLACLWLLAAVGCAGKDAVVVKEAEPATAKVEQTPAASVAAIPPGKMVNAIAAVVNDDIVTLYEVNRDAQPLIQAAEKNAALDESARTQLRRTALDRLVEKRLVDQKVKELNIKVGEEEIRQAIDDVKKQNNMTQEALVAALAGQGLSFDQYRAQLQEQLERLKLVSMEVRSKIQVGETEMNDYYEANRAKYAEDDTFRARHIFFRINEKSPPADVKRAMTAALMVLAEARSGKDFVELAKTYSEDPSARTDGGEMGRFKKGDMLPELERAIMAMKPGDVSELVYTPLGFHIIKLEERVSGKMKPFDSVKAEIEETLYRKKSEERFSQWAKELRGKASVEIKELKGVL